MWLDCGHPTSGVLFQIKKNAKKKKKRYKYEVCRLKRQRDHVARDKLGSALSESRLRDFWKEVRNINKVGKGHVLSAPLIDGFNNIIRKIWSLPRQCHTAPLHLIAGIPSVFNTIVTRSYKLIQSALASTCPVVAKVFRYGIYLIYTSTGHNYHYGHRWWKYYTEQEILSAKFLMDVKFAPHLTLI